jgi:hypothetical protein
MSSHPITDALVDEARQHFWAQRTDKTGPFIVEKAAWAAVTTHVHPGADLLAALQDELVLLRASFADEITGLDPVGPYGHDLPALQTALTAGVVITQILLTEPPIAQENFLRQITPV